MKMMTTTLSKPWKISNKRLSSAAYADLFFYNSGCLLFALIGFIAVTDTPEINKRWDRGIWNPCLRSADNAALFYLF
jgi:hypothetical protein